MRLKILTKLVLVLLIGFASYSQARDKDEKPFAETHVILQLSEAKPLKFSAVLNIANNLIKHYGGPDFVDIEIIGFGAGVEMYFAKGNTNAQRISSLIQNGVKFYVCMNTMDTIERKKGKRPALLPDIEGVQTGVAFMLEEIVDGYIHIHP